MDKLNNDLLNRIEGILNIKFYEWQRNYILGKPMILNMRDVGGRCTGKTFAFIIKKLFERNEPLMLNYPDVLAENCDWFSVGRNLEHAVNNGYPKIFAKALRICYDALIEGGLSPRKVKFPDNKPYAALQHQPDLYYIGGISKWKDQN